MPILVYRRRGGRDGCRRCSTIVSDGLSLLSLFASSFLSATLLPGNSEVVLVAMMVSGVSHPWILVLTATMGNSLGGVTNVILGRFFPLRKTSRWQEKAAGWLKRYGAATLLLSWMPIIGDLLCLLAGWMRIPWGRTIFFLCLGKALRYVALAAATIQGMMWW
ncbi:membrane protein [Salmonella enterica subsp. arizonae]|uniref:Membrane protein n=1 Tax=Salmonella enterica subsp. arizonae TaxID=59203 RepID=A0A379SS90_SALER|nr:membrane protein [Salmonella enterica subsp. arizonae]